MAAQRATGITSSGRTLAERIVSAPRPAASASARHAEWLSAIAATPAGAALQAAEAAHPTYAWLIGSLSDHSPYLWDLVTADPDRLARLLASDPDERLPALLADTVRDVAAASSDTDAMRLLRRMKNESALLIALADIGGAWEVMQVTRALTAVADAALQATVRFLLRAAMRDGKLAPGSADSPEEGCGYVVLAMGKMGAHELNYSSDIDLIVFYDPQASALPAGAEPTGIYVRLTRSLVKMLQERTADGYVFRVDLRLRPDPASTQIAISVPAALDYYESVGQNWERAALIKARPVAGDLALGERLLKDISPFVWRKYLDFAAVADVHAMKRQIHAYRGHDEIAIEGHNVKLGRGGIREIEFFVQTQQLIAGGRHPELRRRETLDMLDVLAAGGWVDAEAARELAEAYRFLRMVEHRLQMVADEQTHSLPADPAALAHFVRFLGFEGRDDFARVFLHHLRTVQRHYAALFEDTPTVEGLERPLVFPRDANDRDTVDHLAELGFRQPLEASATVRRWLSGSYRSLRGEFARGHLVELVPVFLDQLARTEHPDAALAALDRFLAGLHGGARFYSLLHRNRDLVALLATILGTAPRLADILARQPEVMDALLDPTFFGTLPDAEKLAQSLLLSLDQSLSFEDFLDRARMFGHEQMFLIGVRILSGTVSAAQAGEAFARLADVVIRVVRQAVEDQFARLHGRLRGQEAAVLAMGKLGGREMTAGSDLDLIVVYDFDAEHPESEGERPLYGGQYFARFTQRLVNALSAQTNYGRLYAVDMRLRPSGRSGPVATSIASFEDYQENEAWTWEHMALTRARVISGSPAFSARVDEVIRRVLCRERDAQTVAGDVLEMRRAIATEKGDQDRWNIKYAAGGLIDLEFIAQYLQLVHAAARPEILDPSTARVFEKAARFGLLSAEDVDVLRPAIRLYDDLTQILRLCLSGPFDPKSAGAELLGLLARAADLPDFVTLDAHLAETQNRVRRCFAHILGGEP